MGFMGTKIVDSLDGAEGVILVTDLMQGISAADETLLRQAVLAGKRASLFLDGLDKALATIESEDVYRCCLRAIDQVNAVLACPGRSEEETAQWYAKFPNLGDLEVYPEDFMGTVAFGSAEQGWGFTLRLFATMYAKQLRVDEKSMTRVLWGDNFYYADQKRWVNKPLAVDSRRSACQFVFDPIKQLSEAALRKNSMYEKMLVTLGISLSSSDQALSGQPLVTRVMQTWMANDHLSLLLRPLKERVLSSFQKFDKNADGRISTSELSAVMQHLDPTWSGGDLSKLMAKADSNGDGTLDPMEFVQFVFSPSR